MISKKLKLILPILFFYGCLPSHEDEIEFSKWEMEIAPLTNKEFQFIDSLKHEGMNVEIEHYFVGRVYNPEYELIIKFDSSKVHYSNCSELNGFLKKILNNLYVNVIADSVIHDTKHFTITLPNEPMMKDSLCNDEYGSISFRKSDLEKINGFKVEKMKGKEEYYRKKT